MDSILQWAQLAPSRTRRLVGRVLQHLNGVQHPAAPFRRDRPRACWATSFIVGRLRLRSDCVTSRCLLPVSPRPARVPLRTVSRSTGPRSATTRRTPAAPGTERGRRAKETARSTSAVVGECNRPDRLRGRRVEHVQGAELNGAIHTPARRRNDPTSPLPLFHRRNLHSVDHEAGVRPPLARHGLETILGS